MSKIDGSVDMGKDMRLKGSYTIEAAIIVPIFIFLLAIGMRAGLILYDEIRQEREQEILDGMWLVDDFYRFKCMGELTDGD